MGEAPVAAGRHAMRIAIIGPGGIGCLFGGLLSQAGHEVWLVDRQPDRARLLDRRGVWISGVLGEFRCPVRATVHPQEAGPVELVMVAVKSYDTVGAAETARPLLAEGTAVLTVQNGLGNTETLQQALGAERVLGGVTSQAATVISPGQIHHAGSGITIIGEPSGELTDRLTLLTTVLTEARLPTELTTQLAGVVWGKLAVNAGINPVATLAQVRNGGIMESSHLRLLLAAAVREVELVAKAKGVRLPQPDPVAYAEEICQRTANNLNSMLQDIRRRRRTEVEAINEAVVREGAALGVPTPVNQALAWLIRGLEETHAARVGQ